MIKQVIVMRKDLKMRRGKEIAQGSHASISFLSEALERHSFSNGSDNMFEICLSDEEIEWMRGNFTKICLQVNSEQELADIVLAATAAGLNVDAIIDSGKTEFNGIPTKTCCAIGPDDVDKIDKVTGHLKLY